MDRYRHTGYLHCKIANEIDKPHISLEVSVHVNLQMCTRNQHGCYSHAKLKLIGFISENLHAIRISTLCCVCV